MAGPFSRLTRVLAGTCAVLLLASCGASQTEAGEAESFKVGLLLPYSGPLGLYGTITENTVRAYFEKTGPINGREVEFVTYDDEGTPEAGLAGAQRLVERDEVDVIVGPILGPVVLAVAQRLEGGDVPIIGPIPQTDIEQFPLNFSTGFHARQLTEPFGRYAFDELGHRTAYIFASDYVYGREVVAGFRKGFEAAGGEVVGEAYPPLGTTDMVPYLPTGVDADVAFGFTPGADAIRFVKQYAEAGLKDTTDLVAYGMVSNLTLEAIGEDALAVDSLTQSPEEGLGTSAFDEFVETLEGNVPEEPRLNFVHAGAYASAQVIHHALEGLEEDLTPDEFVRAISEVEFEAPWGEFRFDPESGYPYVPSYHVRIVKGDDGRLQQEVVSEVETLSPAEALASLAED